MFDLLKKYLKLAKIFFTIDIVSFIICLFIFIFYRNTEGVLFYDMLIAFGIFFIVAFLTLIMGIIFWLVASKISRKSDIKSSENALLEFQGIKKLFYRSFFLLLLIILALVLFVIWGAMEGAYS